MDSTFDTIWAEHRELVEKLAWQICRGRGPSDQLQNLVSVGQVALWQSGQSFDPSQGTSRWQHSYLRVRGAMVDELRRLDPVGRHGRQKIKKGGELAPWAAAHQVPLDEILMNQIPGNDNPELDLLSKDELRAVTKHLRKLPENLQYVVRRSYLEGALLAEVAVELGVTESRVCQVRSEAVRKIREELMVYCYSCQKSYLDGPSKCPKCRGPIRHLAPGESPPWDRPATLPEPRDLARGSASPEPEAENPALEDSPRDEAPEKLTENSRDDGDLAEAVEPHEEAASICPGTLDGGTKQDDSKIEGELDLDSRSPTRYLPQPDKSSAGERVRYTHDNRTQSVLEWAKETGISPTTILWRIRAGWPKNQILSPSSPKQPPEASNPVATIGPSATETERRRRRGHQPGLVEHEGMSRTVLEWSKIKNLRPDTILTRIKRGWPVAEALDTPEVIKRASSPEDSAPEPTWNKTVQVTLTPRTITLLASLASCNPDTVDDVNGVLGRVLPLAKELEKIDSQLKQLGARRTDLLDEINDLIAEKKTTEGGG